MAGRAVTRPGCESESRLVSGIRQHQTASADSETLNHTIFEGTSEIQQLVIARAISGLRIE
jgi:alkylation response protein AidB-like acyl-CoA dehydrogenase